VQVAARPVLFAHPFTVCRDRDHDTVAYFGRVHLTIYFNYFCPLSKGNGALVYRDPAEKLLLDGKTI
jgi:hypothetical protein